MIRGIEIVANLYADILKDLLEKVDLSQYDWTVDDHLDGYSTFTEGGVKEKRFLEPKICGKEFQQKVFSDPEYSIFSVVFKGFPKGSRFPIIDDYDDFANSDCQVIILIADYDRIDIYAKNMAVLRRIYDNAEKSDKVKLLIYKTDENDCRTKMTVW